LAADAPDRRASYQRRRLWLGITGIGLILVTLWLGLLIGVPAWWQGVLAGWHPVAAGTLTGLALGVLAAMLQGPIDVAAHGAERAWGQVNRPLDVVAYLREVGLSLVGLATAGLCVGLAVWLAGPVWPVALGAALAVVIGLLFVLPRAGGATVDEAWLNEVAAALEAKKLALPAIAWQATDERALNGGWSGVGPWRRLALTNNLADVPPDVAATLIAREIGHAKLGHRWASLAGTILWVVLGIALAWLILPTVWQVGAASLTVALAAVFSTWHWLGLFVWPALGRRQVLAADAFAARAGFDSAAGLDALTRHNLPDEELPPAVAAVFHPIPPMAARRAALKELASCR
jgi:STE24 endopeptidase